MSVGTVAKLKVYVMGDQEEHKRAEGETPSVSAIPPTAEEVPAVVKNEGENHATEDKSVIPIPEETASPPPAAPAAAAVKGAHSPLYLSLYF